MGTGAVLSQIEGGEERVIAYVRKSLEGSEQRYCTARKDVWTDNSVMSWLHRSKDPVGHPAWWIEVIDTYDITFQH